MAGRQRRYRASSIEHATDSPCHTPRGAIQMRGLGDHAGRLRAAAAAYKVDAPVGPPTTRGLQAIHRRCVFIVCPSQFGAFVRIDLARGFGQPGARGCLGTVRPQLADAELLAECPPASFLPGFGPRRRTRLLAGTSKSSSPSSGCASISSAPHTTAAQRIILDIAAWKARASWRRDRIRPEHRKRYITRTLTVRAGTTRAPSEGIQPGRSKIRT